MVQCPPMLPQSPTPAHAALPAPDPEALEHSERLTEAVRAQIQAAGGAIRFDRYMEQVLYAPGLGYYSAGARKFGEAGDFVTAPEISPLFSRCLARECARVLTHLNHGDILEFGAGSGVMAADILLELERLRALPGRYNIIEVSAGLRVRQIETLQSKAAHLCDRVHWLEALPAKPFEGVVLANEVLDAMPVRRFEWRGDSVSEQFVTFDQGFAAEYRTSSDATFISRVSDLADSLGGLGEGYRSEFNPMLVPWLAALAGCHARGVVVLIDYGYGRSEYYHPQRGEGTLMCHYRHRAHDDPFYLPGLQDITAHVDFTAVGHAALEAGYQLAGYTTQAQYLLGAGLDELMAQSDPAAAREHLAMTAQVKKLVLPEEMGDRFKVMALSRDGDWPVQGFAVRDLRDRL